MTDRIWISWNEQRRNAGLAEAVNARLYMSDRDSSRCRRLIRECYESWRIVRREKPTICFTMNPSIFSSLWLSVLARVYRFCLITDLHTPNIELTGFQKKVFQFFFESGIRRSDAVIVTNEIYRQSVLPLNPNVIVIPDPLPVIQCSNKKAGNKYPRQDNKTQLLFICSFDQDEPVNEILALDPAINDFEILITGNWRKMFALMPDTHNLRFLDFVPGEEYDSLLLSVDGIIVLTKREGCLCCGAYEAFAAGKPLILSRTEALQSYFGSAPIYTENKTESILSAMKKTKEEKHERALMMSKERPVLINKFKKGIETLEKALSELHSH